MKSILEKYMRNMKSIWFYDNYYYLLMSYYFKWLSTGGAAASPSFVDGVAAGARLQEPLLGDLRPPCLGGCEAKHREIWDAAEMRELHCKWQRSLCLREHSKLVSTSLSTDWWSWASAWHPWGFASGTHPGYPSRSIMLRRSADHQRAIGLAEPMWTAGPLTRCFHPKRIRYEMIWNDMKWYEMIWNFQFVSFVSFQVLKLKTDRNRRWLLPWTPFGEAAWLVSGQLWGSAAA